MPHRPLLPAQELQWAALPVTEGLAPALESTASQAVQAVQAVQDAGEYLADDPGWIKHD